MRKSIIDSVLREARISSVKTTTIDLHMASADDESEAVLNKFFEIENWFDNVDIKITGRISNAFDYEYGSVRGTHDPGDDIEFEADNLVINLIVDNGEVDKAIENIKEDALRYKRKIEDHLTIEPEVSVGDKTNNSAVMVVEVVGG